MQVYYTPKNGVFPLAEYWRIPGKYYGWRISLLPNAYIRFALRELQRLDPSTRGALIAETSMRVLATDQSEGR